MNKVSLGNSRLLYVEQDLNTIDLNLAVGVIDKYLAVSRQVEPVARSIIVYVSDSKLLVGKEIAGYPTELPDNLKMKDMESCEVLEQKLTQKCSNFKELMENVELIEKDQAKRIFRFVFDIEHFDAPILHFR